MLIHFLLLIPISYAVFVFTSSSFNPFVMSREPFRRRDWRLGRAIAVASLVAGTLAVVMLHGYGLPARSALAIYLILVTVLVVPSAIKYRKSSLWR